MGMAMDVATATAQNKTRFTRFTNQLIGSQFAKFHCIGD